MTFGTTEFAKCFHLVRLTRQTHGRKYFQRLEPSTEADIEAKTVDGKIIVIDTYKKFTNTMDKESQSRFNDVVRRFVTLGGSVIILTHVNKNRDQDGNLVRGGTSDLKDDCDAGAIIDHTENPDGMALVSFNSGCAVNLRFRC